MQNLETLKRIIHTAEHRFFNNDNIDDISYMICQYALARFANNQSEVEIVTIQEFEESGERDANGKQIIVPYLVWYHIRGREYTYIYSKYIDTASEIDDCFCAVRSVFNGLKTMFAGSNIVITPSSEHGASRFCLSIGELMRDI